MLIWWNYSFGWLSSSWWWTFGFNSLGRVFLEFLILEDEDSPFLWNVSANSPSDTSPNTWIASSQLLRNDTFPIMKTWRPVGKMRIFLKFCEYYHEIIVCFESFWSIANRRVWYLHFASLLIKSLYKQNAPFAALLRRQILTALCTCDHCGFIFHTVLVEWFLEYWDLSNAFHAALHLFFCLEIPQIG